MTRLFRSPAAFAAHLATLPMLLDRAQRGALDEAAKVIQDEAKAEIGHYQGAAPPFAAWAPLAGATREDRVRQGFTANNPLLRSGRLRDSIGRRVGDGEAVVGSDEEVAVFQELGTRTIPARSFLGGAMVRKTAEVVEILGRRSVAALAGGGARVPLLGED